MVRVVRALSWNILLRLGLVLALLIALDLPHLAPNAMASDHPMALQHCADIPDDQGHSGGSHHHDNGRSCAALCATFCAGADRIAGAEPVTRIEPVSAAGWVIAAGPVAAASRPVPAQRPPDHGATA